MSKLNAAELARNILVEVADELDEIHALHIRVPVSLINKVNSALILLSTYLVKDK